jgi:hypothetical protein
MNFLFLEATCLLTRGGGGFQVKASCVLGLRMLLGGHQRCDLAAAQTQRHGRGG